MKALLIDLDGVIYQAGEPIAGAVQSLAWLKAQSIAHLFVTNTSSKPRQAIVDKLAAMGVAVTAEQILTPAVAASKWLTQHPDFQPVLLLPPDSQADFGPLPPLTSDGPVAMVVGDLGQLWDFATLNHAFTLLKERPGSILLALGLIRYWRTESGLQLDVGPFVKALEYAAGCPVEVLGKRSKLFFSLALDILDCPASQAIMIGDDIFGDVAAAQQAGLCGIQVKTGKFREADLIGNIQPDVVLDSIADLAQWLKQQGG